MNDLIKCINDSSWRDWSLNKIEINFEEILIHVSGEYEEHIVLCCKDYIGYTFVGHWDESIIEDIYIEKVGDLVKQSLEVILKLYGEKPIKGGGVKDIEDNWYQLNIKLIDGNLVKIAFKSISKNN